MTTPVHGLTGPGRPSPRWADTARLFATVVEVHERSGYRASAAVCRQVYAATQVPDVDAEGLDLRARALVNLAAAADAIGDLTESLRLARECVAVCEQVATLIGDQRRTAAVHAAALVNRAQTATVLHRHTGALADLESATGLLPGRDEDGRVLLEFTLRHTRCTALAGLERWPEAQAEAQAALDLALTHDVRLAAEAYQSLALIARHTGDVGAAVAQLELARELVGDDLAAAANIEENLARMAVQAGDLAAAQSHFAAAEAGHRQAGAERRAEGCRFGRATVLLHQSMLLPARRLARAALESFRASGDAAAQVETQLLLGDIHSAALQFREAEECYLSARALVDPAASPHELARIDVHRAVTVQRAVRTALRPAERRRRLGAAIGLALPAALATDALRQRFPAGPDRERWVREVAGQALATALELIVQAQETRLAAELVELLSASVTVEARTAALPLAATSTAPTSPFSSFTVAAGSGTVTTDPGVFPDLPPQIRFLPGEGAALAEWIEQAERRYQVPVRSAELVDAW